MNDEKYSNYWNHTEENYLNSQKYMECQLVSTINAAICLGEFPIRQNSAEYERLVDLVCGRSGAALTIKQARDYLRLEVFYDKFSWENVIKYLKKQTINTKNPIEFQVKGRNEGLHSVLAVDCDEKKKMIRVTNFEGATKSGWISWKRLLKYIRNGTNKKELPDVFPIYRLNPWYIRQLQIDYNKGVMNRDGDKRKWANPYEGTTIDLKKARKQNGIRKQRSKKRP